MNREQVRKWLEGRGITPDTYEDIDLEGLCLDIIVKCANIAAATPFPESQGALGEKSINGMRTTWMVACHNSSKKIRHYWGLENGHFFPVFTGLPQDTGQLQNWNGTSTGSVEYIRLE